MRRTACGKSEDDHTPSPWFFSVGPDETQSADRFEKFLLAGGKPIHRIAILHENSDIYGDSVSAVTNRLARRLGLRDSDVMDVGYPTVLGQPAVKPGSPSTPAERGLAARLESGLRRIRAFDPDVVFLGSYKADAVATLQTMAKLGYTPPQLLAYGAGYEDKHYFREALRGRPECRLPPANRYGVITRVSWSLQLKAQRDTATKAAAAFKRRYGTDMNGKSSRGFTAMMTLAQAIDSAGSTDPAMNPGGTSTHGPARGEHDHAVGRHPLQQVRAERPGCSSRPRAATSSCFRPNTRRAPPCRSRTPAAQGDDGGFAGGERDA